MSDFIKATVNYSISMGGTKTAKSTTIHISKAHVLCIYVNPSSNSPALVVAQGVLEGFKNSIKGAEDIWLSMDKKDMDSVML